VRGAFGSIFRKLVCNPSCRDAKTCDVRTTCPYARVFEPQAARGEGPSGLADWPRPFVFRASHLDGSSVRQATSAPTGVFSVSLPGPGDYLINVQREGFYELRDYPVHVSAASEVTLVLNPIRELFQSVNVS
jgi:hypothetical protein